MISQTLGINLIYSASCNPGEASALAARTRIMQTGTIFAFKEEERILKRRFSKAVKNDRIFQAKSNWMSMATIAWLAGSACRSGHYGFNLFSETPPSHAPSPPPPPPPPPPLATTTASSMFRRQATKALSVLIRSQGVGSICQPHHHNTRNTYQLHDLKAK